ncbi:MAG: hypothetical protein ACO1SV_23955 [Fimbriimonas sp.]
MSRLASILSRIVWWWALWLMRRSWMKRLQRRAENWLPERKRPAARASVLRQNRFARRYGLKILNVSISLVMASVLLTGCFHLALYMYDSGLLTMSTDLRERIEEK